MESLIKARDAVTLAANDLAESLVQSDPGPEIIIRQLRAEAATLEMRITALVLALAS